MKKVGYVIFIIMLIGCKDSEERIIPIPDFDFELAYYSWPPNPSFPTFETIEFINKTTGGTKYYWHFGNGEISTDQNPFFVYDRSGMYTITLIVTSATGDQVEVTKTIEISDAFLQNIEVTGLFWNSLGELPDWDSSKTADIFIEIWREEDLYFKSIIVQNVSENSTPIIIPVDETVIMNPEDLQSGILDFRLIAIDEGIPYTIHRSRNVSGAGYSSFGLGNSYQITSSFHGVIIKYNSIYQ